MKSELSELYRFFELPEGSSSDDVKRAYRDFVQIWRPDRFADNERLRQKADNKLKEIN